MKSRSTSCLVFFFAFVVHAYSQEEVTLSGTIYTTTVPKGTYTIIISHVGFDNIEETITLIENTRRNFGLTEKSKTLSEVVVKINTTKENIRKPEMSTNKLSIATIKKMPGKAYRHNILCG